MNRFIYRKYIFLTLIFSLLLFAGCVKPSPKSTINKLPDPRTEPIEFVHLPSDYELSVRGYGSTFFFINPMVNSYRKNIYLEKLVGIVNKEDQEFELNVVENEQVQKYIDYFTGRGRKYFEVWLERSGKYVPIFEDMLQARRVPKEIAYLSMIESGFNMKARSNKHAVGPWQFIRSTGKRYNLRIDSWADERMHLEKSTHAAASYLTDLYDIFQSWELALASYNCGERRVFREVRKHKSHDYWVVSESLPRETRNYVPKYFAALIISKNPEKYGFKKPEFIREKDYQLVNVPPSKNLKDIARISNISDETLLDFNPSLISKATPPGSSYQLKVPRIYADQVESKNKEIAALKIVKEPSVTRPKITYYRVRNGDNLGYIAKKFRTSVKSIKRLNKINGTKIFPGQRLRISGSSKSYASSSKSKKRTYTSSSGSTHKVRSGESLSVIAEKYGTSVRSIKSANNLSNTKIKAGQTLRIPKSKSSKSSSKVDYKIRNGDTLSEIAENYRVSVSDLKKWNNMSSNRLTAGKKIVIFR